MSDISQLRVITQDPPLYYSEVKPVDGVQTKIQATYFPILESSVIITGTSVPAISSVDEENGLIEFVTAPGAQDLQVEYKHVMLLDVSLQVFLDMNTDSIRLAAADAIDAIARTQALIQKKIKLLDLETDGPALAKELRASAQVLRDQVAGTNEESAWDIADQIYNWPSFRERVYKDILRGG